MSKSIIALISVLFLAFIFGIMYVRGGMPISPRERESTERACRYGSEITKKGFIGTEFENFDFYESCLDNVYNTSPYSRRPDANQESNQ